MSADDRDLYDDPEGPDAEYEFEDPEELHRVRRLRQIHDARERFEKVRLRTVEGVHENKLTRPQQRRYTAQVALDYVRQLEPLLRRTDSDILDREATVRGRRVTTPNGDTLHVEGTTASVDQLLNTGGYATTRYEYQEHDGATNRTLHKTATAELTLDPAAATRLVRLCDDFLEDIMPSGIITDDDNEWHL
jgi:hypothetical protein